MCACYRLNQKGLRPSRKNWGARDSEEEEDDNDEDGVNKDRYLSNAPPITILQRPQNKSLQTNRPLPYKPHPIKGQPPKPHKRPDLKQDDQKLTKTERKKLTQAEMGGDQRGRGSNQSSEKPVANKKPALLLVKEWDDATPQAPPTSTTPQAPPTSRSRQYNERHKSSRANHNRKAMSDKKRQW